MWQEYFVVGSPEQIKELYKASLYDESYVLIRNSGMPCPQELSKTGRIITTDDIKVRYADPPYVR